MKYIETHLFQLKEELWHVSVFNLCIILRFPLPSNLNSCHATLCAFTHQVKALLHILLLPSKRTSRETQINLFSIYQPNNTEKFFLCSSVQSESNSWFHCCCTAHFNWRMAISLFFYALPPLFRYWSSSYSLAVDWIWNECRRRVFWLSNVLDWSVH